ncbi:MAG: hypothetical protein ACFCD0_27345 [Gemmataceae bacterium]
MEPEIYSSKDGKSEGEEFQAWWESHPEGYYINCRSSEAMLHRVGCWHLGEPVKWDAEDGDVTRNRKVCHDEWVVLLRWAAKEKMVLVPCGDCLASPG